MVYLIGSIAIVLIGFFIYASVKKNKKNGKRSGAEDKPPFRTEKDLDTYDKPMDEKRSHIDFEDME